MLSKNRLQVLAASAAVLFGTLAMGAPVSAATYGSYTCPLSQTANTTGYRFWYVFRPMTNTTAPTTQTEAKTGTTPVTAAPKTAAPAPTAPTATSVGLTAEEQQMLNLVNQERAKVGIAPLKADPELTKLARLKSQDMINLHYFSHQSPTYGSPFDMMNKYGVTYRTAGENIAGNSSVAGTHTSLMNSAGHRANILNPNFNYVGIGIVHGGQYGMMFTQQFVGR